ncbi:hypothetical protein CsSME_00025178 [Camellia sinensis var. sinensis]
MAVMSSKTPLNRSVIEASKVRNPEATTSNRSVKKKITLTGNLTRFSNRVTHSFKASITNTVYEQPGFDTNCHRLIFSL